MRFLKHCSCAMIIMLSACTTTVSTVNLVQSPELRQVNVISVTNKVINFDINDKFAWQTALVASGDKALGTQGNIARLQNQVKKDLNGRGYVVTESPLDTNYFLVGVVLLEGYEQAAEHKELLLGLDPGMHPSKEYGLGSLLLGVRDAKSGDLVWRGAVQILLAGENSALTAQERKARVDHAIKMLVDGLFDHTK